MAFSSRVCVPTGTVPTTQLPVAVYVPRLGLLETKVKPVGSKSFTVTACDALGPALVRLMVYLTLPVMFGVAPEMILTKLRSALAASGAVTVFWLLPATLSVEVLETLAVFEIGSGLA